MTVTLLREKSPEFEVFVFEGVEESGSEVEAWLGDAFESLLPSRDAVEFKYGPRGQYEAAACAGELIFRPVDSPEWLSVGYLDDLEDYEAVTV